MKSNNEVINNTITGKQIKVALQPTKYKDLDINKQKVYDDIVSKINFLTDSEKLFDSVMKPIDDLIDLFKDDLSNYCWLKALHEMQIYLGDTFYYYDAQNNIIKKDVVKAIALQPDGATIINWIYNKNNIYKNKDDCIHFAIAELQKDCDSKIEKLQKGVEDNANEEV